MTKRPLSALSVGASTAAPGEGSVPELPQEPPPPAAAPAPALAMHPPTPQPLAAVIPADPRTAMTYRPRVRIHDQLRRLSYERRRSMQELLDEAVETWLAGQ